MGILKGGYFECAEGVVCGLIELQFECDCGAYETTVSLGSLAHVDSLWDLSKSASHLSPLTGV